jgi:hypothetical protein
MGMNKYLEKIASMIPRNVARLAKDGLGKMMGDAAGKGVRAGKAYVANSERSWAEAAVHASKDMQNQYRTAGKAGGVHPWRNVRLGNEDKKLFQAEKNLVKITLRAKRTAQASDLATKGAKKTLGVAGAAGVVGIGATTAAAAHASTKKE